MVLFCCLVGEMEWNGLGSAHLLHKKGGIAGEMQRRLPVSCALWMRCSGEGAARGGGSQRDEDEMQQRGELRTSAAAPGELRRRGEMRWHQRLPMSCALWAEMQWRRSCMRRRQRSEPRAAAAVPDEMRSGGSQVEINNPSGESRTVFFLLIVKETRTM